MSQIL